MQKVFSPIDMLSVACILLSFLAINVHETITDQKLKIYGWSCFALILAISAKSIVATGIVTWLQVVEFIRSSCKAKKKKKKLSKKHFPKRQQQPASSISPDKLRQLSQWHSSTPRIPKVTSSHRWLKFHLHSTKNSSFIKHSKFSR